MSYVDPWIITDEATGKLIGVVDYSKCRTLPIYINDDEDEKIGVTMEYEKAFGLYMLNKPSYEEVKTFIFETNYEWFSYLNKLAFAKVPHLQKIIKEFIEEEDNHIQQCVENRRKYPSDSNEKIFYDVCIEQSVERKNKYKSILNILQIPKSNKEGYITRMDVERAKSIPVDSLIDFKYSKRCCIFHQEKTPSMHYFKKNNIAHCFGCGAHADSIQVAMQLWGTNFIDTVKKLTNK